MGIFFFDGKKHGFDLSLLSAGIRISDDNELLKKYDKNNNSIFDAEELTSFIDDAEKVLDTNGDKHISKQEAMNWAKLLGLSLSKQEEITSGKGNIVQDSFEYLYAEQAKENAIEILNNDVVNSMEITRAAHGGAITQLWNAIKEGLGSDNAESNVYKQLFYKSMGASLLQSLSSGEITLHEINEILDNMESLLPGADEKAEILHAEFRVFRSSIMSYISKLGVQNTNQQISFEKLFKYMTGIEFDPVKINEYKKKSIQAQFAASVNNKLAPLQHDLAKKFESLWWDEENGVKLPGLEFGNETEGPIFHLRELRNSVVNALNSYFNGDNEKINQYVQKTMKVSYVTELGRKELLQFAKVLYQDLGAKKDTILKQVLGNKSLEDFSEELSASYKKAFGDKGTDIARDFAESQQTGMTAAKIGVGVASLAVVILSEGTLTPILLGTATSIGGIAAVDLTENLTKEGGMTPEDWQNMKEELKVSGLFAAAGIGIGMTSAKIGMTLLAKCPQFMGKVASLVVSKGVEYASDFAMTVLTDMAITGEINLTGDTIAELLNIIMGIAAAKKMRTAKKKLTEKQKTETPPVSQPRTTEPKTSKSILADKSHKITQEEMDIIRKDAERIFNSEKPTAEKLEELRSINNELSKMTQTPEAIALQKYIDSAEAYLKNISDVEGVLREVGFKEENGNWKDEITIEDEIASLIASKEERVYKTKEGEVRVKYDEETGMCIIKKDRPVRVLEGGVRDTDLTEVAHEARHLAGSGDTVANPVFDPKAAERICNELKLTDADKFILENLREGDTHIIDGPDNTEIVIIKGSEDYDVQVRMKENEVSIKDTSAARVRDPYELSRGQMSKGTEYNINPDRLPVLEIGGEYIDLNKPEYARLIFSLKEGTGITIGREGTILTNPHNVYVSRTHVEIYKQNGQLKIRDISANGTNVYRAAEGMPIAEAATGEMLPQMAYEVSANNLPILEFPGGVKLDLSKYASSIRNLKDGQCLTIGKEGNIPVRGNDYISRCHVIVYKSNGVLKIKNIHPNQVKLISNGFLDRIKSKIKDLMGSGKSEFHSSVKLTEHERQMFNALRDYPEVRALISKPAELKKLLGNINKILADRSIVSEEVAEAMLTGSARLNGSSPEKVACMVDKNLMSDILKMAKGEDYIMRFPGGVQEHEVLKRLPVGEVANIGGKLYVNNGSRLESINMSEATFRQLFPPVTRFSTHQGYVGDCYLVSTLERMYASPLGRVKLYRRIGEDANGIYTLTANNNYDKTYFNRFDSKNKHIQEEGGLAILEQGWCKNSARGAREFNPRETRIMQVNEGGLSNWAIGGLIGREPTRTKDPASMRRYIMQYANNPDNIINVGTRSGGYHDDTHFHNRQYNIYTNHEYSIKGYNPNNDCILLCNPHHSGCVVEVPLNEFLKYCDDFTIINMNN